MRDATLRRDVNALRSTQELLPDVDAILTVNDLAQTFKNLNLKIEIKAVELTKGIRKFDMSFDKFGYFFLPHMAPTYLVALTQKQKEQAGKERREKGERTERKNRK